VADETKKIEQPPHRTEQGEVPHRPRRHPHWIWPVGILAAGVGGVAAFLLRGCWHTQMGWPIREGEYSYQVCTGCGVKRLFDEEAFQGYGPYGYDLHELVARARARHIRKIHEAAPPAKSAGQK
jgi:hypothetical protein